MDILPTPSPLPSEDQLVLKSSRTDNNGPSHALPYQPNVVRVDIDSSRYSKDANNDDSKQMTRGSTSHISPQIQASAYFNDSENLTVPTVSTNTAKIEQGHNNAPHPTTTTSPLATVLQPETDMHAHTSTTAFALEPATPPSQLHQEGGGLVSATPCSNDKVTSSATSILSASGTLVSHEAQGRLSSSTHCSPHPLSRTTTAHTLAVSPVGTPFDAQQFKTVYQRLTTFTEQFEALNDQLLDALTSYDESRLGLDFGSANGSHLTFEPTPLLARAGSTPVVNPASNLPIRSQPPTQRTVRLNKPQIKAATQLKDTIVAFWSAQSNFQDRAQLVLDIYQDPSELEDEGRIRSLRSRHLNNLLSSSLTPSEADRLSEKVQRDQDRITQITEQVQGAWLEIVLVLSEPSTTAKGACRDKAGDTIAESDVSFWKSKRQAFKGRPTELRYTDTHLDTIFALSTHPGKAGIAVVRVSGPQAKTVLKSMTLAKSPFPKPRQAVTRRLTCPQTNELLDKGMVVWFPGPRSFTGEDSVEFHCHGGKAVVDGILRGIGNTGSHIRLAEPGEFARRAFENDKLDLTEVEGLADLLNAETEAQRRLALRQADGGLKNLYETWRTQLIQSMALIEALIDFGEDENIEDDVYDHVVAKVKTLYRDIRKHTDDDRCGEILRDGIHVTILGPPNAGKSSFLNFISTTRDVVEVSLDIGGYPILIGDTAGLRSSQDEIEMEGVRRAQDRIQLADINIAILPVTDFMTSKHCMTGGGVDPIVLEAVRKNPKTMVLINKMDLPGLDTDKTMAAVRSMLWDDTYQNVQGKESEGRQRLWAISCQTGEGIGQFLQDFITILKDRFESSMSSSTSITQYRHRKHLENCLQSLEAFLELGADDIVLGAEELRHAASDLGRITGRVDVEEVLDVVFREFCIGK
ncbi:tRNA modification GTPase gtpbp3, mitochondrial [Mortierella sp. AD031]|nr:tRNA modification GTPase gtpbp3, mitochondrial [Mortierella sp. AD031]